MPVVLLCYYGVALPTGCALGFSAGWGARGMVAGMLGGKLLHAAAFAVLVATTDWQAERRRAARSVADGAEGATTATRGREAAAGMVAALGGEGEGEGEAEGEGEEAEPGLASGRSKRSWVPSRRMTDVLQGDAPGRAA